MTNEDIFLFLEHLMNTSAKIVEAFSRGAYKEVVQITQESQIRSMRSIMSRQYIDDRMTFEKLKDTVEIARSMTETELDIAKTFWKAGIRSVTNSILFDDVEKYIVDMETGEIVKKIEDKQQ